MPAARSTTASPADQDLADELDHYDEQAAAEWEGKGLSPAEARRKAEWQLGTRRSASEEVRDYGWENVVDRFGADVRHSIRRLRAKPVFAAVAVLTLALGIGASTAIFSVVEPRRSQFMITRDASGYGSGSNSTGPMAIRGYHEALGASHRDVVRLVFRQGMTLTAIGIVVGLPGAIASSRAIASLLFSISELDFTTYVSVVALLLSISAATCAIPAWRASRIDPAITLKAE